MTQNETSGKQLFEWVKASERVPPHGEIVPVKVLRHKHPNDTEVYISLASWYEPAKGWAGQNGNVVEWLSPAQPSTGKQLPTDEEIYEAARSYAGTSGIELENGFEAGAFWLRSYEGRGEDKTDSL